MVVAPSWPLAALGSLVSGHVDQAITLPVLERGDPRFWSGDIGRPLAVEAGGRTALLCRLCGGDGRPSIRARRSPSVYVWWRARAASIP